VRGAAMTARSWCGRSSSFVPLCGVRRGGIGAAAAGDRSGPGRSRRQRPITVHLYFRTETVWPEAGAMDSSQQCDDDAGDIVGCERLFAREVGERGAEHSGFHGARCDA